MARTRTIVLAATKGGAGKTTISIALAIRAAEAGERVAVIDRDPTQCLRDWHSRRKNKSTLDIIEAESTAEAVGLVAAMGYDWVIVDTPPLLQEYVDDAVSQADLVLIPSRVSALDLTAIHPVIGACNSYGKPFAFVLNAVDPRHRMTQSAADYLAQHGRVMRTMIVDRVAYAAAMLHGRGPTEVAGGEKAGEEIDALWGEIKAALRKVKHGQR